MAELTAIYPDARDLTNSTAAARINGYLGGHGALEQLESEMESLGLSEEGEQKLHDIVSTRPGASGLQCQSDQSCEIGE